MYEVFDLLEGLFGRPSDLMGWALAWDGKDPGANLHSVTLGKSFHLSAFLSYLLSFFNTLN